MLDQNLRSGFAVLVLLAMPLVAKTAEPLPGEAFLISQEHLQQAITKPRVRILDARPQADYDKGHIPGAVWVDVKLIQALAKPASIKDAGKWARALAPLGIGKNISSVFIYDGDRQHDAARVWWSLRYAGATATLGLVDGGFDRWQADKRPVSIEPVQVEAVEFETRFNDKLVAGREEVAKREAQLVDARSFEEYTGAQPPKTPNAPVGHIPGARNLDSYSLVDKEGRFLEKVELKRRVAEAGFTADKPIIVYSAGGNRSSIAIFALEQIGISARHYVGGFGDWAREAKLGVVKGRNPGD